MYNSISEFRENFPFKQYVADMYNIHDSGHRTFIKIPCPFHPETTASCAIYEKSFHCYGAGCGAHGSSFDFLKSQGFTVTEILNLDYQHDYIPTANLIKKVRSAVIPEILVKIYNKDLLADNEKMQYVLNRHFDVESIEKSKIGYVYHSERIFSNFEAPRYIIPVYDNQKKLLTARYRIDPAYESEYQEPKYLGHPNSNSALYNSHLIQNHQNIVIVGSEFDAAFLYYRYEIYAIAPPGEGNFRREWMEDFTRDHNVLIWLDYDYAGISAALNLYESFKSVCHTKIYKWDNSFKNKQDVCDFVDRFGIQGIYEELDNYDIKAYNQLGREA